MAGEPLQDTLTEYDPTWLRDRIWLVQRDKAQQLPIRIVNPLLQYGVVIVPYTAWEFWLSKQAANSLWDVPVIIGILSVALIFVRRSMYKGKAKYETVHGAMPHAPESARMVAIGHRNDIGPVSELINEPFEPIIVHRSMSRALSIATMVLMLLCVVFITELTSKNPVAGAFGWVTVMIGMLVGQSVSLFRPVYFRMVPGRLDIMRYDGWRRKPITIERVDLRNSRIHVNVGLGTVEISNPNISKKKYHLSTISEPLRFIQGLFQAAICTTSAPSLPDDELLG